MPMPPYPIHCSSPGCNQLAQYKIAARWSDGITGDLKTYALTCPGCLAESFQRSAQKQNACRLAANETLEQPGIYALQRGRREAPLERLSDLERQLQEQGMSASGGSS